MKTPPSGTDIIHEVECVLAQSRDRGISKLGQSPRVLDFLDSQRYKIEQGQWSAQSFYLDRIRLAWTNDWRKAEPAVRQAVGNCLASTGARIAHAEQMQGLWAQLQEVGESLGVGNTVKAAVNLASRLASRRSLEEPMARGPHNPSM